MTSIKEAAGTALTRLYIAVTMRRLFFWAAVATAVLLLALLLVLGIGLSQHPG